MVHAWSCHSQQKTAGMRTLNDDKYVRTLKVFASKCIIFFSKVNFFLLKMALHDENSSLLIAFSIVVVDHT